MKITVRYFASIRESLGPAQSLDLPGGTTVGELRNRLIDTSPAHAAALARGKALRCALDQALCDESALVHDGAEVAFFPPVTGG
ncbi:MAG TPA: molybdopterin converting factor subunit 1 [Albitalea sp.]|nr:molybdopterin converting factor subunit 1 [Albitalea sp.]